MRYGIRIGALALLVVCVNAVAASAATVTLSTTTGTPTTKLTVSGTGYQLSGLLDVYWDTQQIGFAASDVNGALSGYGLTVPASAVPGTHYVTIKNDGAAGGGQAAFTVRTSWTMSGYGSAQRAYNPFENVLTADTASGLDLSWQAIGNAGTSAWSTPITYGGNLYFKSNDGTLQAWSTTTHTLKWSTGTESTGLSGPAAGSGLILVSGPILYAYSSSTGALVWYGQIGSGAGAGFSTPVISNGVVYVAAEGIPSPGIYAFKLTCATGGAACIPIWHGSAGSTSSSWSFPAPPAVGSGEVAAALTTGFYGFKIGCATGGAACAPVWINLPAGSTVAYSNGHFLTVPGNGNIDVYPACTSSPCARIWQLVSASGTGSPIAISANRIFMVTGTQLESFPTACISALCGAIEAVSVPTGAELSGPVVAGNVVYVQAGKHIWAYQATKLSGGPLWSAYAPMHASFTTTPIVSDGVVYAVNGTAQPAEVDAWDLSAPGLLAPAKPPLLAALKP